MQTRDNSHTLQYITETFVHEPAWLAPVRAAGEALRPGMQLSAYEGHLLRWLAQLTGARHALEIGTFMGYSTLWLASSGAQVTSLEFQADYAERARQHIASSPYAAQVRVEQGDALAWLAAQPAAPTFDLLFIDAEKRRYGDYLDRAWPLLTPNALIVADNSLLWGAVSGEVPDAASAESVRAMRAFNARLADPLQFDGLMLPTIEGLTVARRRA